MEVLLQAVCSNQQLRRPPPSFKRPVSYVSELGQAPDKLAFSSTKRLPRARSPSIHAMSDPAPPARIDRTDAVSNLGRGGPRQDSEPSERIAPSSEPACARAASRSIGRLSPSVSAREAKLCRKSWMHALSNPGTTNLTTRTNKSSCRPGLATARKSYATKAAYPCRLGVDSANRSDVFRIENPRKHQCFRGLGLVAGAGFEPATFRL